MLTFRAFLFTLLVPGLVSIGIPRLLSILFPDRIELGWWRYAGIAALVPGVLLYLAGIIRFVVTGKGTPAAWFARQWGFIIGEEPTNLVSNGIYRRTRNPLYLGVVSVVLGQAILTGTIVLFLYTIVLWFAFHGVVVLLEEPHLRKKYGEAYAQYTNSTPRWLG